MGVKSIEVRDNSAVVAVEKLNKKLDAMEAKMDKMQTDISQIKKDVEVKP